MVDDFVCECLGLCGPFGVQLGIMQKVYKEQFVKGVMDSSRMNIEVLKIND